MLDRNFENYYEPIEQEFFRLKGRPGILSPTDFALTRSWYEAELSLSIVLEGMASAFKAHRAGRPNIEDNIGSLVYCQPFVEKAASKRKKY